MVCPAPFVAYATTVIKLAPEACIIASSSASVLRMKDMSSTFARYTALAPPALVKFNRPLYPHGFRSPHPDTSTFG
jgi:hypothetical protein